LLRENSCNSCQKCIVCSTKKIVSIQFLRSNCLLVEWQHKYKETLIRSPIGSQSFLSGTEFFLEIGVILQCL
jgi:hypothetical protein